MPHVKGVTEFEIYEEVTLIPFVSVHFHSFFSSPQVLMSPRYTVLPWDSRTQPEYTLNYKVGFSSKLLGTSGSSLFTLVLRR